MWFAVVSDQSQETVELLPSLQEAEQFIADMRADDPGLANLLRIELVDLGVGDLSQN
jgi:hypothetical protein